MADHPLLFRGEMIRALLAGTKTQTRRPAWRPHRTVLGAMFKPLPLITAAMRIKVGDLVWVREGCHNWSAGDVWRARWLRDADDSECSTFNQRGEAQGRDAKPGRRASMHMPRKDSRLTLVVTDVRVQPLQDISEADATAEGVTIFDPASVNPIARPFAFDLPNSDRATGSTARRAYEVLWRAIHGDAAWHTNPEVVAITFTVHKQNIDAFTATRAAA